MTTYQPLTPEEEKVIIDKETELPYSGEYLHTTLVGTYLCKRCLSPLYRSSDKFDSHCGWPSFDDAIPGRVTRTIDQRWTEVICTNCKAHLGHVFTGEQLTEKNTRHCVNSLSMKFVPEIVEEPAQEKATLGGGCFWCLDSAFREIQGVLEITSGYSGGTSPFPTYEKVTRGDSGYIEVVEIIFDPRILSYQTVLEVFFSLHNPTTPERQGNDVGPQYASAIFYRTETQKETALLVIKNLEQEKIFEDPIVTKLIPFDTFWTAEEYHQNYLSKSPSNPYCAIIINPKLAKMRKQWEHLLKKT